MLTEDETCEQTRASQQRGAWLTQIWNVIEHSDRGPLSEKPVRHKL